MKEFIIQTNESNQRFDKYLKKLLPEAGSGFLYKMLRKKNIDLNEKKATGTEILVKGDKVRLFFSDETFAKFHGNEDHTAQEYESLKALSLPNIRICYEDDDILIASKPANMLSQKAKSDDVSINEYLLGYLIRNEALTQQNFATFRPSVCNRLDRNTTGLILMGKSLKGSQELSRQLKARTLQKYYLALVDGRITKPAKLKGYLHKDEKTNQVTIANTRINPDDSYVETEYVPVEHGTNCTLLEVHLITGKTHQIRAHLASISHPIIGDPKYGDLKINQRYRKQYGVKSQLLHAYRIVLEDGRTYTAIYPSIMDEILDNE